FAPVAQFVAAVERESAAPVGRREPHLLAGQQRRRVNEVAERERPGTAREARMNDDFDFDGPARPRPHPGLKSQPPPHIKYVADRIGLQIRTAWELVLSVIILVVIVIIHFHPFSPSGYKEGTNSEITEAVCRIH